MLFSTWLRNQKKSLQRLLAAHQTRRQKSTAHPLARTLLCLELLEDRVTPSGFQSLYSFTGGTDGYLPQGGVIADSSGNVYGPTTSGGANNEGTVFQFNTGSSTLTTLHSFNYNDGSGPANSLIRDGSGNFYGMTDGGAPLNAGQVYELSSDGKTVTTLHAFTNTEGAKPNCTLMMDSKGNIYGTTFLGGAASQGTVFELTPNGSGGYTYNLLHTFPGGVGGAQPEGGLVMDNNGNLYGTTEQGGPSNVGTVYELSPNGSGGFNYTILHNFSGSDGQQPWRNLILDGQGNLYGVTYSGGTTGNGTVFKMSTSGSSFTVLHSFATSEGAQIDGTLLMDSQGNLYGTAGGGGTAGDGTVFELSPNGTGGYNATVLHNFTGSDGKSPTTGVSTDGKGNLYGSTALGGANNSGTIFEITGVIAAGSTTTASNASAFFSPNAQNVTLSANVTSGSGTVNEGTVTFTLLQNGTPIGTATTSNTVSNGQASVSYALPANLTHGTYTIDAVYSGGTDFPGSSDTTHTLTITPANVTTKANSLSCTYTNTSTQNLLLSANVSDASISTDTVNEGTVTFTVKDSKGNTVGSAVSGTVNSSGQASAYFTLPKGQSAGNYSINVSYSDSTGNFVDGGDTSGTLTVDPSNADTTANNIPTVYSTKAHTVSLTASVADDVDPTEIISEGNVTFSVMKGSTPIGTAQGSVSNGAAKANFLLPAGLLPGNYTIKVSYSDSLGNFSDFLDTPGTLAIAPANVVTTASNVSTIYRVNSQTVNLTASVADTSFPADTVNEGVVTFTVKSGTTTIGTAQGTVNSSGVANAFLALSAGQASGNYTVDVGYSDSAGRFTDSGDTPSTLTITAAQVTTTAGNASAVYSPNSRTLALSAAVADTSVPTDVVGEGKVTFTILNGSMQVGSAQGTVSNGVATGNFSVPAGLVAGSYSIVVSYSDSAGNFTDSGDTGATLIIKPANVVTTAAASNITFNPAAQPVALTATVADSSIPSDTVGAGIVTFTIENSQIVVGSISAPVKSGAASANFNWSPGRAAGNYTIAVSYTDGAGNFSDGGDNSSTLTVAPALVTTTAANASAVYSPNVQNVVLSASVACPGVLISSLDTDTVTFTVKSGSTVIGTAQGVVSDGLVNANFALPAGQASGNYTIAVSYSDSHGNFSDGGDTSATLAISPANVTATANNAIVIYPNSQSATLTAVVSDSSNPNDKVSEGAVTFTVKNGTTVIGSPVAGTVANGTASASFSLPAAIAAGNYSIGVNYSDTANNFSDSGDSSATLTVLLAPIVTANPSAETVSVGSTAKLTAAANASPTLAVQWQVSSDDGKTYTNISDATSATLTLSNVQASQNGNMYQAVFTNSYGTATTSAATLTVSFAPTVATNPSNQTAAAGKDVTFTAAANGSPSPTVQWQVSTDSGKTFTNISGATSTTLTLTSVQPSQDGYDYQAVFTNSLGTATTSAATLTVQYAPSVTINPSNQTVTASETATFTATASSNPAATVQWQVSTDGGKTFTNISGATSTTLTLAGVTTAVSGNEYQAIFTNSIGSATTSAATLTVNPATIPIIAGNPTSQTASAGGTVTFTASSSGDPAPTVQWQVSTDGGITYNNINGATSTTLTLAGVSPVMNGYKYQAVFSNSGGSAVSVPVTLTVNAPSSPNQLPALKVPPLLALIGELISGLETINANNTESVVYSLFGITLATATYDASGNFMGATLFGFSIPNSVWYL